ncbi:amino acid-binding protein [Cryobacterium tagatosivorans]|uniref:amino acid-binding protein n=1 Tax=Cryobacterium tagatosivorans TaxID=1259199 RepID=UPI001F53E458|nr:amino acid-binding protein [Cryobacterium tagatosivorans]
MTRGNARKPGTGKPSTAELTCDSCGQLPEASKGRLTVVNVVTILPIELLVHAVIVQAELPYLAKVLVLAGTATALVIWVAEPSARRLLWSWLHAPALRRRRKLDTSPALWRVRTVLADAPGALERLTHGLARLEANILSIHVHPVSAGVLDELVLSAPGDLTEDDLFVAVEAGGGRSTRLWPTTAVALTDGQTRALTLAARVAENPGDLGPAIAELLAAELVVDLSGAPDPRVTKLGPTLLKVPTTWHAPLIFSRPGEPFTPAESGRAHRLAELAEVVELTQLSRSGPAGVRPAPPTGA